MQRGVTCPQVLKLLAWRTSAPVLVTNQVAQGAGDVKAALGAAWFRPATRATRSGRGVRE